MPRLTLALLFACFATTACQGSETAKAAAAAVSTPAAAAAPATVGQWRSGVHYQPLNPAQPTNVAPGKVEVLEFFWYGCGHCYVLEPYVEKWLQKKPASVEFVRVPIIWSPIHKAQARLYYTLQALNRLDLHKQVFDQTQQNRRAFAGETDEETLKLQVAFAQANGINPKTFSDAFKSFAVNTSLQRAEQAQGRYNVQAVPQVIIDGKYLTDVGRAGGHGQLMTLINDISGKQAQR
jgi:protein dithiol oxidoreductase (disulfide-forming)